MAVPLCGIQVRMVAAWCGVSTDGAGPVERLTSSTSLQVPFVFRRAETRWSSAKDAG